MISTALDFCNSTMFIVYINVDPRLIVMSSHSPASVLFVPKYQPRSGVWGLHAMAAMLQN